MGRFLKTSWSVRGRIQLQSACFWVFRWLWKSMLSYYCNL
jgi:hypothetical protein